MNDLDRERARRLSPMPSLPIIRGGGSAAFVGQVVAAPSGVGQYMTVHPTTITGTETAGQPGTIVVDTGTTIPVYFVGRVVPTAGDKLVCRLVDYRWVAEKKGATSGGGGACTGNLVPIAPTFNYFSCPNGGFPSGRPSLAMTQGPPWYGSNVLIPVFPLGGGFPNHHVTMSDLAWYTPFTAALNGNAAMAGQSVSGGSVGLYFLGCQGFLITVFADGSGNPFVYNYDITWSFPLQASAVTQGGLTYGANTNNPFQIGHATTTQSGSGPALTGQFGPIITGGTGTSVFAATSVGVPVFSP